MMFSKAKCVAMPHPLNMPAGVGADATYSNSTAADTYLARQSPDYMGGHAIVYHDRTFPQFQFLEHSLRTGCQPELARQLVSPILDMFAGRSSGCGRMACQLVLCFWFKGLMYITSSHWQGIGDGAGMLGITSH